LPVNSYNVEAIHNAMWSFLRTHNTSVTKTVWNPPITHLNFSVSKFTESIDKETDSITKWFKRKDPALMEGPSTSAAAQRKRDSDQEIQLDDDDDDDIDVLYETNGANMVVDDSDEDAIRDHEGAIRDHENAIRDDEEDEEIIVDYLSFLPPSISDIPVDAMDSLPPHIKQEIIQFYDTKTRNVLSRITGAAEKEAKRSLSGKKGRKKKSTKGVQKPPRQQEGDKSRKISEYFRTYRNSQPRL
jgi:hypothetical protein